MSTSSLQSHLSVLESSARSHPTRPAFRQPVVDKETSRILEWNTVTYAEFSHHVELYSRYWSSVLSADGIAPGSIIGLWLGGAAYTDVLHIYGLSRAGYIPQMFSLRLPNPVVIFELLQKAGASALVCEPSFGVDLSECPVPTYSAIQVREQDAADVPLPPLRADYSASDIVFIFHTSGSTSGSPKLVRCSRRWLDNVVTKSRQLGQVRSTHGQDVSVAIGSMCHIGQTNMLIASLCHASCTIQPTSIAFSSEELLDMITRCGLNRLRQFATFLGHNIRASKTNPKLLQALVQLDEVVYSGLPLGREEEAWAVQNGIKLHNLFGSTEVGAMLISIGGKGQDAPLLVPLEGTSYGFFPVESEDQPSTSDAAYQSSTERLLELVILSESGDCPDVSLRRADGHFHTGDLFLEVGAGKYLSRGRKDDWIKSENSLRCDTKSIEDNVRATCGELIHECIVVGNGRPSPALFVEASEKCAMDAEKLKKEIIRRTRQFHARRYVHERIISPKNVVVVERGTLPRTATKGNVRRQAVEDQFKELLDGIYGTVPQY